MSFEMEFLLVFLEDTGFYTRELKIFFTSSSCQFKCLLSHFI